MADGVAFGEVGIFGFHIGSQMAALRGFRAGADMGKRPDLIVGTDMALVALAGVDGGAFFHDGILQQGMGPDNAPRTDDGLSPQDASGQNGGSRRDLHFRIDIHITADKFHAVIQMALKGGSVTLLRQIKFFFGGRHKNPPSIIGNYTAIVPHTGQFRNPKKGPGNRKNNKSTKETKKAAFRTISELSAQYIVHVFCANCNTLGRKVCWFFSQTIEHFFNNPLEIPFRVCYNGLCKHETLYANTLPFLGG